MFFRLFGIRACSSVHPRYVGETGCLSRGKEPPIAGRPAVSTLVRISSQMSGTKEDEFPIVRLCMVGPHLRKGT